MSELYWYFEEIADENHYLTNWVDNVHVQRVHAWLQRKWYSSIDIFDKIQKYCMEVWLSKQKQDWQQYVQYT